jgi:two-component system, cell cycle sensor histidine kinase PleC
MTDVAAEIIALRCAVDPAAATRRGRLAAEIREAREKLTPSASSQPSFDVELLRLFAKGRRSSGPAMAVLGGVASAAAATWVAIDAVLIWLALDFAALGVAYRIAGKFLDAEETMLDASRWRRKFVFAETLQGIAWAAIVWLVSQSGDPAARSYALVLLLPRRGSGRGGRRHDADDRRNSKFPASSEPFRWNLAADCIGMRYAALFHVPCQEAA